MLSDYPLKLPRHLNLSFKLALILAVVAAGWLFIHLSGWGEVEVILKDGPVDVQTKTSNDTWAGYLENVESKPTTEKAPIYDGPLVIISDVQIPVEVRRTPAELAEGLSGRLGLPDSDGMLFIFSPGSRPAFWMPDMNFPIDIVWVAQGRIVGITANVSNEFDATNPKYYYPPQPIDRVLEVNAGFMARHGFQIGGEVTFLNL